LYFILEVVRRRGTYYNIKILTIYLYSLVLNKGFAALQMLKEVDKDNQQGYKDCL
jgi:hypothetical protein